jgi:hypothetical protein
MMITTRRSPVACDVDCDCDCDCDADREFVVLSVNAVADGSSGTEVPATFGEACNLAGEGTADEVSESTKAAPSASSGSAAEAERNDVPRELRGRDLLLLDEAARAREVRPEEDEEKRRAMMEDEVPPVPVPDPEAEAEAVLEEREVGESVD